MKTLQIKIIAALSGVIFLFQVSNTFAGPSIAECIARVLETSHALKPNATLDLELLKAAETASPSGVPLITLIRYETHEPVTLAEIKALEARAEASQVEILPEFSPLLGGKGNRDAATFVVMGTADAQMNFFSDLQANVVKDRDQLTAKILNSQEKQPVLRSFFARLELKRFNGSAELAKFIATLTGNSLIQNESDGQIYVAVKRDQFLNLMEVKSASRSFAKNGATLQTDEVSQIHEELDALRTRTSHWLELGDFVVVSSQRISDLMELSDRHVEEVSAYNSQRFDPEVFQEIIARKTIAPQVTEPDVSESTIEGSSFQTPLDMEMGYGRTSIGILRNNLAPYREAVRSQHWIAITDGRGGQRTNRAILMDPEWGATARLEELENAYRTAAGLDSASTIPASITDYFKSIQGLPLSSSENSVSSNLLTNTTKSGADLIQSVREKRTGTILFSLARKERAYFLIPIIPADAVVENPAPPPSAPVEAVAPRVETVAALVETPPNSLPAPAPLKITQAAPSLTIPRSELWNLLPRPKDMPAPEDTIPSSLSSQELANASTRQNLVRHFAHGKASLVITSQDGTPVGLAVSPREFKKRGMQLLKDYDQQLYNATAVAEFANLYAKRAEQSGHFRTRDLDVRDEGDVTELLSAFDRSFSIVRSDEFDRDGFILLRFKQSSVKMDENTNAENKTLQSVPSPNEDVDDFVLEMDSIVEQLLDPKATFDSTFTPELVGLLTRMNTSIESNTVLKAELAALFAEDQISQAEAQLGRVPEAHRKLLEDTLKKMKIAVVSHQEEITKLQAERDAETAKAANAQRTAGLIQRAIKMTHESPEKLARLHDTFDGSLAKLTDAQVQNVGDQIVFHPKVAEDVKKISVQTVEGVASYLGYIASGGAASQIMIVKTLPKGHGSKRVAGRYIVITVPFQGKIAVLGIVPAQGAGSDSMDTQLRSRAADLGF